MSIKCKTQRLFQFVRFRLFDDFKKETTLNSENTVFVVQFSFLYQFTAVFQRDCMYCEVFCTTKTLPQSSGA